jgi:hypothetical protein
MIKSVFYIFCFCFLGSGLFAQKVEVERRIKANALPDQVLEFLQKKYPDKRRIKHYEEYNEKGRFYESKFCYEEKRYSVKFDSSGQLYDIERAVKFKSLPASISQQIESHLSDHFQRYRVVKVQEQLVDGQVAGYELEAKGKASGRLGYFEFQFDTRGNQKSVRAVEKPDNDFFFF